MSAQQRFQEVFFRVAGVTFEGRQSHLARMHGAEPCRIVPEPDNPHDANALAVHVALSNGVQHVGYVPRDAAAQIAPMLEGEAVMIEIVEITGGFEMEHGERANLGLIMRVMLPIVESDETDDVPF